MDLQAKWKLIQAWAGAKPDGDPGNLTADAIIAKAGLLPKRAMQDPAAFFAGIRKLTGPLNAEQVATINGLLQAAQHWPTGWLAYGLATAWHEAWLKPTEEIGKGKGKKYGVPGARMKAIDKPPKYGGQIPYGRGLVQLTWAENYEWADKALNLGGALLKNFALALDPAIATAILVKGMESGAFTGKSLSDYIGDRGTVASFTNARRIINGTDRAEKIAGDAITFQDAVDAGKWK